MQNPIHPNSNEFQGILPVNKPCGKTSFSLVACLRRILGVKKIGHAGTLDPFASGVMVMLIGREFTRLSDKFLTADKEYSARIQLGIETDTYDHTGQIIKTSPLVPTQVDLVEALKQFQGQIDQIPPMFSAKKQNGKKLYELARKGKEVERQPQKVIVKTTLLHYAYPYIDIRVACSKGTYIRSIAHDLGNLLGSGGHLVSLNRLRSGGFHLDDCMDGTLLYDSMLDVNGLRTMILDFL